MAETGTRTVERALTLLSAVATRGGTLTELARAADLSPSTASRLLATLVAEGLIQRDEHGRYGAGGRLRQLAAATLRTNPVYELAGPHLSALAAETGETANLAAGAERGRVVYLRQVAGTNLVQTAGWVGRTVPGRGTALGAALRGEVEADGYVARAGAVEPDVTSIAAPVYGAGGDIAAALSVLAPSYRMTPRRIAACGSAVARHATELSRSLGAPAADAAAPGATSGATAATRDDPTTPRAAAA
jgi:IclR family transcriptional regulator, KDG regulon repressor